MRRNGARHEPGSHRAPALQPRPRREGVEGRVHPLRHPQGGIRRLSGGRRAHHGPRRRLLLARRARGHLEDMVGCGPGRLRANDGHRAGRVQRDRNVRAAVQRHTGRVPAHRFLRARAMDRRAPARGHRAGFCDRPAAYPAQSAGHPACDHRLRERSRCAANSLDDRLRESSGQCHRRPGPAPRPRWPLRPRRRHGGLTDRHGADRWPRRHSPEQRAVLQH